LLPISHASKRNRTRWKKLRELERKLKRAATKRMPKGGKACENDAWEGKPPTKAQRRKTSKGRRGVSTEN